MRNDIITIRTLYQKQYRPSMQKRLGSRRCQPWVTGINRFAAFLEHEPRLSDLSEEKLDEFMQWLSRVYGPKSGENSATVIRSLWRFAHRHRLVESRPPAKYVRKTRRRKTDQPDLPADPLSLVYLFETMYRPLRLLGSGQSGLLQHHVVLRHFRRFLAHEPTIADLDDMTVSRFIEWLVGVRGQCAVTANKSADKLLAQWKFLNRRRIVESWPEVRKLPEPEITPLAWLDSDLQKLCDTIASEPGHTSGIRYSDWWSALHLLLWDTGERISAILGLLWSDIDLDGAWVTIRAELRKCRKRSIVRKLRPETVAQLRRIERKDNELVLPWDRAHSELWAEYKKLRKKAGVAVDKRSGFHRMRRTVATKFEAAGGDATKLLDHSARSLTVKSYLDRRFIKEQQACDLLPPLPTAVDKGGAA